MTQQTPLPPRPQTVAQPSNGLGTTGFVLGLIGLLLSFIPLIGIVAWPLVVLGIIFSAIGIAKASKGRATNKGLAIAGLAVSIIGLVVCFLWAFAFKKAADDINEESNREVTISYEVTGDAANSDIIYTTYGSGSTTNQEKVPALPWSKEVKTKGFVKGGSLTVSTGEEGGTVTCKVTVDGQDAKTATASGVFAVATCDGF